jgi:quinol-cytochrome oxidoreductase complex cytochrome b subunit
MTTALYEWVDERLGLHEILAFAKKKTVPVHAHSFWYYWGGLSLFFFTVQVVTGILLLVYYRPGADAYESVRQITFQMQFGWLIRSAHSWSANLMIFAIFVHMFSVFFMKAYKKPREFGWFSGLGLLGLVMVFGFSGYLLPMDELSYFATKVGLQIPGTVPLIGPALADMIRGGPDVSEFTVQRFFALHVVILPALFLPLLGFHLWLVQRHGNAVPPKVRMLKAEQHRSMPFFPNFFVKDMAMWLIALNVLAVLASLFPWTLGKQADPLVPAPAGIHPEWYFMSPFQTLKWMGSIFPGAVGDVLGMVVFNLLVVVWAVIPLYDNAVQEDRRARLAYYFGLFLLTGMAVTTLGGYWGVRS